MPPASLVGPSLPTPSELALFERAGFLTRRVAVAGELATRCRQLTGSGPVDWRPLALFRQTHQAQLLADQALALKQAGCPPELWLDSDEGLAFAACSSDSRLSLEAIEEGHGEMTFRCDAGLEAPLDPRPTRLQVQP